MVSIVVDTGRKGVKRVIHVVEKNLFKVHEDVFRWRCSWQEAQDTGQWPTFPSGSRRLSRWPLFDQPCWRLVKCDTSSHGRESVFTVQHRPERPP